MNFTVFMPMRTNRMKYVGIVLALLLGTFSGRAADSTGRKLVYTFPIREDIMPSVERLTGKCLAQADEMGADLVVIQMNTYGGVVAAPIRSARCCSIPGFRYGCGSTTRPLRPAR